METKPFSISQSWLNEMRNYAWDYFIVHAQARLTTFRFYLVFCTIILTGLFTAISTNSPPYITITLSFLLSILSFIYWKVDIRHKNLIKNGESALIWIENTVVLPIENEEPHPLKIFQRDMHLSNSQKIFPKTTKNPIANWHYSTCVNAIFVLFGLIGLTFGIFLLISIIPIHIEVRFE